VVNELDELLVVAMEQKTYKFDCLTLVKPLSRCKSSDYSSKSFFSQPSEARELGQLVGSKQGAARL
jgi:hypothetical protein